MSSSRDPDFLPNPYSIRESANARRMSISGGPVAVLVGFVALAIVVFLLRLVF